MLGSAGVVQMTVCDGAMTLRFAAQVGGILRPWAYR
jgi:hypothetical protein